MQYLGSKKRMVKHILPIMLEQRKEKMVWVEPFVGGANMIGNVVFISEYNAPPDFSCIKTVDFSSVLNKNKRVNKTEKLFQYKI